MHGKEESMSDTQALEFGLDRRDFMRLAAGAAGMVAAASLGLPGSARAATVELPPLPWVEDALEPHISARTISFHYGKHHAGYIKKTQAAIKGTPMRSESLVHIVRQSFGTNLDVYQNAAQAWNHDFYWNCMKPGGGGKPSGKLLRAMERSFGTYEGFVKAFKKEAGHFGSGWAWLIEKNGRLEAISTPNADTPIAHGVNPIMTCDLWEHAYYLDYQNKRGAYVDAFLNHLVDWDFVQGNML
jgi:Fe-Mn family superoxide dismutase